MQLFLWWFTKLQVASFEMKKHLVLNWFHPYISFPIIEAFFLNNMLYMNFGVPFHLMPKFITKLELFKKRRYWRQHFPHYTMHNIYHFSPFLLFLFLLIFKPWINRFKQSKGMDHTANTAHLWDSMVIVLQICCLNTQRLMKREQDYVFSPICSPL